ncbi:hypothetical protein KJY73_13610 [Bowmanella sp. Y26]|uniref:hypothetical protein n=1 Tax=Bowmanella yangjiangensis TaxID=2811230 RepID=UPI001BDCED33|nr:hypothetical protein [Bowmanella yangjiangensis]MBT1064622.1 hypothetical protein [Bowmanella yangjiangensis]
MQQEVKNSAKPPSLLPWIGISVVAHMLVVLALLQKNTLPKQKVAETTIKAKLWTMPPKPAPLSSEPVEQPVVTELQTEPGTVSETVEPVPAPDIDEQIPPLPSEQKDTEVATVDATTPTVTEPPLSAESGKVLGGNSEHMSMAQRHLRNWHSQQQQQVAERAARQFRQQQNNPVGEIPDYSERLSEDEQRMQDLMVEANCDSTSNKVAAVLMGIAGGMVKCSKPPPIQKFIDERLKRNKNQ